jgi:hypothetical protein
MRATAFLKGAKMNPCAANLDALLAFPVVLAGNGIDVEL